ncbi:MAG TPA: DUF86 domain-containing protein [Methylomusa anaerophila]|uniref:DUF86 domain-containing protein n=1 Tax=Methylomusa anaerophila TaxID=1930071 RepID=A0A348AIP5_9FIRM|nr:DUF86 domain-containing protein [Methylomusa anaerophila]BBB90943.1 hypothetical protein MAMMFC1_01610 [Methylomusa anaerophila]HML90429.1 DUF86 domain-containing protein [Methylomusa anaerophila]
MSRKKNREYRDYIEDIYNDLVRVREFTEGLTFEEFMLDVRTQYAVCKALENMGEASKHIPESIRRKFPQIPFKQMAGLRDVVTHNYDGIGYDMIWQVVTHDLPPIEGHLMDILSQNF